MKNTKISWCDHTVNLWWGCTKVSEACENCYAEALARRFKKDCFGKGKERWTRLDKAFAEIQKLNESAKKRGVVETVFVNSMSDFFDDAMIVEYRLAAWRFFSGAKHLRFLILTKRANVMANHFREWGQQLPFNVQFGITAENQQRLDERMGLLKSFSLKFFISVEPMLEPINILPYVDKIDWVICGGESGNRAREFKRDWGDELCAQCIEKDIPFFFKQLGNRWGDIQANVSDSPGFYVFETWRKFPAWHPKGGIK